MLIEARRSALLIVDMQERLMPAMDGAEPVIANAARLMEAAGRLGVPILVSEQYPKGLGRTVPALAALAPTGAIAEKLHFSCAADPGWRARFEKLDRRQPILAGVEAHVCVLQTALALAEAGYRPAVVADAVASRRPESKAVALDRLRRNGVEVVTTEMVLFEWLGQAGTPEFKALSGLIR
ncbi:MAG TPA: hydrolase [Alphaproteobacteria bacterium]|jgi:nicotinamidase-related amidase